MSNIGGRRAELHRINTRNKEILVRLKNTTAYYNNQESAKDWKVYRKHLEHMGKYAYKGGGKMNGSVQKILQKGLPKPTDALKHRAATASGRQREPLSQHQSQRGNLSAQVRMSMHYQNNNKTGKQKSKKKNMKKLRPLTSPIKMPRSHSLVKPKQ